MLMAPASRGREGSLGGQRDLLSSQRSSALEMASWRCSSLQDVRLESTWATCGEERGYSLCAAVDGVAFGAEVSG
jgi:hypothetical protein